MKDAYVTTVSLLPRHKAYLEALKRAERQNVSDTIRRALDEYMKAYPVDMTPEKAEDKNE